MNREPAPRSVVVVGAGIVGLCCAYYLRQEGLDVTVIDRGRLGGGASRGNAGLICPSTAQPLATPHAVRSAVGGLYRSDSALHIHPAPSAGLIRFLGAFVARATRRHFQAGVRALSELGADALRRFDELANAGIDVDINKKGGLYVFGSTQSAEHVHALVRDMSVGAGPLLTHSELAAREPSLAPRARAGFEIDGAWAVDPSVFVDQLAHLLEKSGVRIVEGARVHRCAETSGRSIVRTSIGEFAADRVVIAAGVWSAEISAMSGVSLNMYPGKGYSFSVTFENTLSQVIKLEQARVALTPMGEHVRIAGTMEFDRDHDRLNPGRIAAIVNAARPYLRGVDWSQLSAEWVGPRPMTPDSLPLIGRLPGHRTTYLATGHNMLGLALGPSTGSMIADLITGRRGELPALRPERVARPARRGSSLRLSLLFNR